MCVVSMISDHYTDKFRRLLEPAQPFAQPFMPYVESPIMITQPQQDKAKEFVEDFKELYEKAKRYDIETGQPDCELDEKKQTLKRLAKMLGVEIDFL